MAQKNLRDIIAEIRTGNISPVYILMGEEAYFIDLIVENLEAFAVDEADKDFNCNIYYGSDADLDTVVAAAQQFPVMAPRKLVMLKEAQTLWNAKTALEALAPYVGRPNATTVFAIVFKGGALSKTSALLRMAEKSDAVVFNSPVPRSWELPTQLKDYCRMRQVSIEDKGVALLCDTIGAPLSKLFGEVNKLIQIKGGKGSRITCEDIEKNIGISKDFNNFEFVAALGARDYPKAMKIISYFERNPKSNPTVITTATMFDFFTKLVIAHYLPDKSDASIMRSLGLKGKLALGDIKNGLANYNAMHAVNAIHHIREFDTKSKGVGSYQNEYALLKEAVFKIFT